MVRKVGGRFKVWELQSYVMFSEALSSGTRQSVEDSGAPPPFSFCCSVMIAQHVEKKAAAFSFQAMEQEARSGHGARCSRSDCVNLSCRLCT